MKEFYALLDHLKSLYENGMYEDVKLVADLLLGVSSDVSNPNSNSNSTSNTATSSSNMPITSASMSPSSATAANLSAGSSTETPGSLASATSTNLAPGSFAAVPFQCDSRDKYMIYYWHGNAAFNLKEYKLAESLFNKALQINNKSNLRPKPKTLTSLDSDTDITIKYNLHLCLFYDKKYQEAYTIVSYLVKLKL